MFKFTDIPMWLLPFWTMGAPLAWAIAQLALTHVGIGRAAASPAH